MGPSKARSTRKLRSWMVEQVTSGRYPGLVWDDEDQTMFRIPWKHAGKQDFRSDEDGAIFKAWAEFKGKMTAENSNEPATWKTRLHCALNKSQEFKEVAERSQLDISEPYKVYRLVPVNEQGAAGNEELKPKRAGGKSRSRTKWSGSSEEEEWSEKKMKEESESAPLCVEEILLRGDVMLQAEGGTQQIFISQGSGRTSLSEDTASMFLMDRYEEDCSDSALSFCQMIDEEDEEDEEEMHFKSHCEICKEAQQSPEYEKVTPRKISKWSFQVQLKGEGTYECSATGLVFEVSEQALVRYSVLSWSKFSEFLKDSWRPAGSIYDVDVVNKDPSVLKFIHFPHTLCLAEPEHELSFSVLHVKGSHANIESTVGFTASHVKWRVSSLSPLGPIIPKSQHVKHHGVVLIYMELGHKKTFTYHVYLALNCKAEIQAIEEQVSKSSEKCIKISKPAACRLEEKFYHLTSEPEGEIEPKEMEFTTEVIAIKNYFEVYFNQPPPFKFILNDSDSSQTLWATTIRGNQAGQKKPCSKVIPNSNSLVQDTNRETHSGGQDLTEKQLMMVARTLGQEWEEVAIHLELETKDLGNIKAEHTTVAMQKQNMLVRWKRLRPGKATAQDLLSSLEDLKDLPCETRDLLQGMKNGSLMPPDHQANA